MWIKAKWLFYGHWVGWDGPQNSVFKYRVVTRLPWEEGGKGRMLGGSLGDPRVVQLQEASKGSDLGKGKQKAHHTQGQSFEDGHHPRPVQASLSIDALLSLVCQSK